MSYKWPDKDKDETLDYSIDWSRILEGGDTVSSATWYIDDADGVKTEAQDNTPINGLGVLFGGTTISNGKVTTVRLASGTNNVRYRITCKISISSTGLNNGLIYERSVFLRVKEK